MKSNRKQYQETEHEFSTRAAARKFGNENAVTGFMVERRYAPKSVNAAPDGYVCVVRVQERAFGPINDQRFYL